MVTQVLEGVGAGAGREVSAAAALVAVSPVSSVPSGRGGGGGGDRAGGPPQTGGRSQRRPVVLARAEIVHLPADTGGGSIRAAAQTHTHTHTHTDRQTDRQSMGRWRAASVAEH